MKINFLVSSMHAGGAERVASVLCNRWVADGHEVTLIPTYSGRGECVYPLSEEVRLLYLADYVKDGREGSSGSLGRFTALRQIIRSTRADVVVSFLTPVNIVALLSSIGLPVKVVVSERVYPPMMPLEWRWRLLRRLLYGRATRVIAQTGEAARWLQRNCPGSHVVVIPNPVTLPLASDLPAKQPDDWFGDNRRVMMAAGRFVRQKGMDLLLESFSRVAESFPEWDLVIAGEGPLRQQLEEMVGRSGLTGRVHMPGQVGNLADWYERSEFFVMTSRFEGFPNTMVEAMAHGLPALAFDCKTGPRDIIHDGVNGILVENGDVDGLTAKMRNLLEEDDRRAEMGLRAREVIVRFSLDEVTNLWYEALSGE